jgi:hypothetical protein
MRPRCQGEQRRKSNFANKHDIATAATIAAVWATLGAILLSAQTDTAVTSLAGANEDSAAVNEHGRVLSVRNALF